MDLAIMPIGAYDPWIRAHCNPEEALTMANHAGAEFVLPVHHRTFKLSNELSGEPMERLLLASGSALNRSAVQEIDDEFHLGASAAGRVADRLPAHRHLRSAGAQRSARPGAGSARQGRLPRLPRALPADAQRLKQRSTAQPAIGLAGQRRRDSMPRSSSAGASVGLRIWALSPI